MSSTISSSKFLVSEQGMLLRAELMKMVKSRRYNTKPIYSTFSSDKNQFVEKHMNYMSKHPSMDHWQYVSNIKLMTKIKK